MAYSEKDLAHQWIPSTRIPNGADVNLAAIQYLIQNQAEENGIPVAFTKDTLKTGGLFSKDREDVLIMYNPKHAGDYLKFLIRVQHQGKYAFFHVFNMGGSKNFRDINGAEESGVFGTIQKAKNIVSGVKTKVLEEENYYAILKDCLENIFR